MITLACGMEIDHLYPIGARVRHNEHGLMGTIEKHEYCRPGVPSAVPYKVRWDDTKAARQALGLLYWWGLHENLTEVTI